MDTHPCPICGTPVSNERSELLGIPYCIRHTTQGPIPKGVMDYSEKAGGYLQVITDPIIFKMMKRPINQQR